MIVQLQPWQVKIQEIREKYPVGTRIKGTTMQYQKHGGRITGHFYCIRKFYVRVIWDGNNPFSLHHEYTVESLEKCFGIDVPFEVPTRTTYAIN